MLACVSVVYSVGPLMAYMCRGKCVNKLNRIAMVPKEELALQEQRLIIVPVQKLAKRRDGQQPKILYNSGALFEKQVLLVKVIHD